MTNQTDLALTTLEEIYSYLETHALDFKDVYEIGGLFKNFRDKLHESRREDETTKAQWEIDIFNFDIKNNKLNPMSSYTNNKGEIVSYPPMNFPEETYEYFKERLIATSNPLLKARYAHFLWLSPYRHQSFAKGAVDGYLELIDIYEGKDKRYPDHSYGLDVLHAVENAYSLARIISFRLAEIRDKINQIVHQYSYHSSSSSVLRFRLVEIMLRNKTLFTIADYESLTIVSSTVAENLAKANNLHGAINMLRLTIKISERLKKKPGEWEEKIACHYETLMLQAENQNNLAAITFCQDAIKEYKKLGDRGKVEELEKKFVAFKTSARFPKIETTLELTDHFNNCRSIAEKVAERSGAEIVRLLMFDKSLLPGYDVMDKRAEKAERVFILQSIFSTSQMDQNCNPVQHFSSPAENRYYKILNEYNMEIDVIKIHLINMIFFESARVRKLTAPCLLDFWSKYSWFGKVLSKTVAGNTTNYNWLNLIAPAINEYFRQLGIYFENPAYGCNFVLCIDSLVLKFEGLFRDICSMYGVSTQIFTRDKAERNTVYEKDINALLYEDKVKELFDKDDLLLFKAVLIEQASYNLRNRVAHALLPFEEYGFSQMNLLLMALLRIGKYDFTRDEVRIEKDGSTSCNSPNDMD